MENSRIYRRGDIVFVSTTSGSFGSEQMGGRPAVVVSNNACNTFSSVIEVVYMTTADKKPLPTHVRLDSCNRPSTVLCEQIDSISKDRISNYFGRCSEEEIDQIDKALKVSLNLEPHGSRHFNGMLCRWVLDFNTALA